MKMATISTHVLDTARGEPVAGVRVVLSHMDGDRWDGTTGPDGRFRVEEPVPLGGYLLHFDISDHVLAGAHLEHHLSRGVGRLPSPLPAAPRSARSIAASPAVTASSPLSGHARSSAFRAPR